MRCARADLVGSSSGSLDIRPHPARAAADNTWQRVRQSACGDRCPSSPPRVFVHGRRAGGATAQHGTAGELEEEKHGHRPLAAAGDGRGAETRGREDKGQFGNFRWEGQTASHVTKPLPRHSNTSLVLAQGGILRSLVSSRVWDARFRSSGSKIGRS